MSDPILKQVKEALDKAIAEKKISQEMVRNLSPAIIQTLTPILQEIAENSRLTKKDIIDALSQIKITVPKSEVDVKLPEIRVPEANVKVEMPEIKVPEVKVNIPEIKIPKIVVPKPEVTVNVPPIKIPKMEWPEGNMPIEGLVSLKGISKSNPLPVELRDANGNPLSFPEYIGGGGGGIARNIKIGGFSQSAYADYINSDGRLRVSVETGGSGLTDNELRASHLDVDQLSGSTWSVSVNDIFRTTVASNLINSDDRLRVSVETGGSGLTDAELRATALQVLQFSGAINSVNVTQIAGNTAVVGTGYQDNALRVVHATDAIASVNIVSGIFSAVGDTGGGEEVDNALRVVLANGAIASVQVKGFDTSVAANIVDSSGVAYTTTNPLPIGDAGGSLTVDATNLDIRDLTSVDVVTVADITNSVKATIIDSSGVQYSGSNPVPVTGSVSVSGSVTSTVVVGPIVADAADDGNAPVQVGGVARQTNPTAVADNDIVKSTHDDLGRQITRIQVRDLTQSAYVTLTNGTETTLLAGVASTFLDLMWLVAANNSDAAVTVDFRSGTAGTVLFTLQVPANGTAGIGPNALIKQEVAAGTWTADMGDITGTSVYISALFSKEV